MRAEPARWNHNIHYHPVILREVTPGSTRALDVGCGEGILTRQLRELVPNVTGIDLDEPSIELARWQDPGSGIEYLHGDFRTQDLEPESFDLIGSVATLHHMDAVGALRRMRELLRPGGKLAIIGLARSQLPADLPAVLAALLAHRFYLLRRTFWEHSAPMVWPPPETYPSMRRIAAEMLPGMRWRRHLLWRYSLIWTKPRD